jgi:Fic family protein
LPAHVQELLHRVDLHAGGRVGMPVPIANPETRDQYYVASLIEEAITSSQLEGASTTRQVAKDMIRSGRPPTDRSERMILNNYRTMQSIRRHGVAPLSQQLLFEIHHSVTHGTLDDETAAGRFRRPEETINVIDDRDGTVLHTPPLAEELPERIVALCSFANATDDNTRPFLHPVLRSIILHFWLAYDHPFVDGNGRTARALFYWSMLRHGYWLVEFLTISNIIRHAPAQYARAFLYTETDENDLTYFIHYHLGVLDRAIQGLQEYIARKSAQRQRLESVLRDRPDLNHRQRDLLGHAIRHPNSRYTIEEHRVSHDVVYQTARTDLLGLAEVGLLDASKVGRRWYFTAVAELEQHFSRTPQR